MKAVIFASILIFLLLAALFPLIGWLLDQLEHRRSSTRTHDQPQETT